MAVTTDIWVTTVDNKFNPFTQYDDWEAEDARLGYFTPEYIARIAQTSFDMDEVDYNQAINDAVCDILEYNLTGKYTLATPDYIYPLVT